ncbi:MAG: hypothetical protein ACJAUV_000989 [Flavobacteriales bacterium]|jgi:hypothetical protein
MSKRYYKILAIVFGVMTIGGLSEMSRIMTSTASDIAPQRGSLTIMALVFLAILVVLTGYFWKKSK